MKFLKNKIFGIISEEAALMGTRAFVIGGFVRDSLLGRKSKDIDIVVEGSGIDLAERVAIRLDVNLTVFRSFGTAMLKYGKMEIEFVGARNESYRADSRKPIVEDGSLEDDQKRRDFTINALAFSLQKEDFENLVDPFTGVKDLQEGKIGRA
ncbi:MAG: tRNA nucleotidyltransferase, partial [Bacteroidales bacterium]|nr:tRNA nucleotidyltransferase [Bacteroidales bacterium]